MQAEVTGGGNSYQANALEDTTEKVKATIVEKDLATLVTLDTGNSWVVEVDRQVLDDPATADTDETDLVISAANLNTLNGLTDQVVTVTAQL